MKTKKMSHSSNSIDSKLSECSSNSNEIVKYVDEFKKEVEGKYIKSKTNHTYIFPKKPQKSHSKKDLKHESVDSLKDVRFYDLASQNIKNQLINTLNSKKKSETTILVDVLKKVGGLDSRYLHSQIKNCESTYFKILYQSIQKKVIKDLKSKDSIQSCSIKTKQIFTVEKNKLETLVKNDEKELSFQKHFIPVDYTTRVPSAKKIPNNQNMVPIMPKKLVFATENISKSKNVSISPRKSKTKIVQSLKPIKSEKQLIKPNTNSLRGGLIRANNNQSKSNSRINQSRNENTSIFQNVKSNINCSKNGQEKSKSKIKIVKSPAEIKPNPLKSHISLTKEQLRNLIQKNIYRGSNNEAELNSIKVGIKNTHLEDNKKSTKNLPSLRGKVN